MSDVQKPPTLGKLRLDITKAITTQISGQEMAHSDSWRRCVSSELQVSELNDADSVTNKFKIQSLCCDGEYFCCYYSWGGSRDKDMKVTLSM